tara:strand:- start:238 stop:1017 length:780 start_codon:yes stop_codon:yes gene_type:complete
MKLLINDAKKSDQFGTIFQNLTQIANEIAMRFSCEKVYVQGMDSSHVCMFELVLKKEWFTEFNFDQGNDQEFICLNTSNMHKVLNIREENQSIEISTKNDDFLHIKFKSDHKTEFNKQFKMSLLDNTVQELTIPEFEYSAEINIPTRKISKLIDQFALFHDTVNITCSEEEIKFDVQGDTGTMEVDIPLEDLNEFLMDEDATVSVTFAVNLLKRVCQFYKLTDEGVLNLSNDYPLRMDYNLENECHLRLYLAPKFDDTE